MALAEPASNVIDFSTYKAKHKKVEPSQETTPVLVWYPVWVMMPVPKE